MPEQFCTEWEEVTPTQESTAKGLRRAAAVLLVSIVLFLLVPIGEWMVLTILLGVGAILSFGLDLDRLRRKERLFVRFQFDDRRLEQVWRAESMAAPKPSVYAYDALGLVKIRKGTVGLYFHGDDTPEEVLAPEQFPDREMLDALLVRIAAHDVKIVYEDNSLDGARFGPSALSRP